MSAVGLVHKTVAVLRTVAASNGGIGLSELSRVTGIPKATCLRIVAVLDEEQLVALDAESKRYAVALGALALAGSLLDPGGAHRIIARELETLASATQETAGLDVLRGTEVVVIEQVAGPQLIGQTAKPVPRSLATWNTSTGKVLLASLDADELESTHARALAEAARRRRSERAFRRELERVRTNGYAVARDEMEQGAAAVAAPVVIRGEVAAAVWIGGPSFRLTDTRVAEVAAEVMACGRRLGEALSLTGARPRPR